MKLLIRTVFLKATPVKIVLRTEQNRTEHYFKTSTLLYKVKMKMDINNEYEISLNTRRT